MAKENIIKLMVALLAFLYALSSMVNGTGFQWLAGAVPYILLYCACRAAFSWNHRAVSSALFVALCVAGIIEAVIGISQVFGILSSNHPLFSITGSFNNPGPFGGFMSVVAVTAASYLVIKRKTGKDYLEPVAFFTLFVCLLVLPASMSRGGWLAFAAAIGLCLVRETGTPQWAYRHKLATAVSSIAILLVLAGVFLLKKDSAIGRLHIWNIECRAIAHHPLLGTGPGTFPGTYGMEQADYFRSRKRPDIIVKVAGSPEYAFNEYLKIGVESGLPSKAVSIMIAMAAVAALAGRHSPIAYGLMALCVFAFFSYPLSLPPFASMTAVFLSAAATEEIRNTGTPGIAIIVVLCIASFVVWKMQYKAPESYRSIFDRGYSMHKCGMYEKSNEVLIKGSSISSDPMFHVIMGKNYEALGKNDEAVKEYELAHFMVPCRLYPLQRMMEMYASDGRTDDVLRVYSEIKEMPVNGRNGNMVRIRRECDAFVRKIKDAEEYGQ